MRGTRRRLPARGLSHQLLSFGDNGPYQMLSGVRPAADRRSEPGQGNNHEALGIEAETPEARLRLPDRRADDGDSHHDRDDVIDRRALGRDQAGAGSSPSLPRRADNRRPINSCSSPDGRPSAPSCFLREIGAEILISGRQFVLSSPFRSSAPTNCQFLGLR